MKIGGGYAANENITFHRPLSTIHYLDYCHAISPRGLKDATHQPQVRGTWRLQPVIKLKKKG